MQERKRGYYRQIAQLAIIGGCMFCIAAVIIFLMTLDNGNSVPPKLIFLMVAASTFPSLIGGFLLIMAGLILNAVVGPPSE